jgi:hypothetical protein
MAAACAPVEASRTIEDMTQPTNITCAKGYVAPTYSEVSDEERTSFDAEVAAARASVDAGRILAGAAELARALHA